MAQTTKTTRPGKAMKLTGTVFTGNGEGKKYLTLPWVKQQLQTQLGYTPYPGTLNLHLSEENAARRKLLETPDATRIQPAKGYSTGILHKAYIGTVECAIIIPEIPTYPHDYLEIIAADYLREKLNLKDGTEITVTVDL